MTGAEGFLGWHVRCALLASAKYHVVPIARTDWESVRLSSALQSVDAVIHLAGVNRAASPSDLDRNVTLAHDLTAALDEAGNRPIIVFANSIQSGNETAFGVAKEAAARHFDEWARRAGGHFVDVRLPNIFGEHGRPNYNSVVATFSFLLAGGRTPVILEDRTIPLLHAQDAADVLIALAESGSDGVFRPEGRPYKVSDVLDKLRHFRDLYDTGDIPDVTDAFDRAMFNTYRSFCFPDHFPKFAALKEDDRGALFESVRAHGGQSQVFCSTTRAGITRGNHFHRRKIERFMVLHGEASISLRRLFGETIVRFEVDGRHPAMVDMPTMWTHSITNTGPGELLTLFWADEIPVHGSSDTHPEPVEIVGASA